MCINTKFFLSHIFARVTKRFQKKKMNTNIIAEILADEFANDKIDIDIHISILFKIYTKKEIIISHTLQKNA